jgi:hypothetical protein
MDFFDEKNRAVCPEPGLIGLISGVGINAAGNTGNRQRESLNEKKDRL